MIKEILLFLWIFVFPILFWLSKSFFTKTGKRKDVSSSQKKYTGFFLYMEILLYLFGFPMIIYMSENFKEALYIFCFFQIIAIDMIFSALIFPNIWMKWHIYKKLSTKLDTLKGYRFVIFVFLYGLLLCTSFSFSLLFVCFRFTSIFGIFFEQKISLTLIIFILLFNPIYMFYQMKERLLKDG